MLIYRVVDPKHSKCIRKDGHSFNRLGRLKTVSRQKPSKKSSLSVGMHKRRNQHWNW